MNIAITSKEAILGECRKLVMEKGISAVNMRNVANACGVAVGSIYNYFPSKSALISAAVEEVWRDIFHMDGETMQFGHFTDCIEWFFERTKKGYAKYPGFFTLHAMSFASADKEQGRRLMEQYFSHMKQSMVRILKNDKAVSKDIFDDALTPEALVDMVFTVVMSMLMEGREDCEALVKMTAHCIYKDK